MLMILKENRAYLDFTQWVRSLQGRLHSCDGACLRCNDLKGMTIPRRYALPCTTTAAHSTLSN